MLLNASNVEMTDVGEEGLLSSPPVMVGSVSVFQVQVDKNYQKDSNMTWNNIIHIIIKSKGVKRGRE